MPRAPRDIWTSEKRNALREWHDWAKKHPEIAKGDNSSGAFFLHLERERPELLAFAAESKSDAIRGWLAEEHLIKI